MKLFLTTLLLIALIIPVFAEELSEAPIVESSFVMKEESKAEIKEVAPITIDIQPYLSSGALLSRTVEAKELPVQQMVTSLVKQTNRGVVKEKIVQMYPEATLELSDNAETVKQSTTTGTVKVEMYYDYQKSVSQPWSKYYKVENCDATKCRVVRAEFSTRRVWIEEIAVAQANAISGIPSYDALPNGVKL